MAAFMVTAIVVSGCGNQQKPATQDSTGNKPAAEGNQTVTLNFAWWGSQERNTRTQDAIKIFEQKHPNIKVTTQFSPWSGYWDKISTQISGGSAPDVMQMDISYLREYTERGSLLDLKTLGINTSDVDATVLKTGEVNGKLTGIPSAVNAMAVIYDPALLSKAGVTINQGERYTWDQYAQTTAQVAQKLGKGFYGSADPTANYMGIDVLDYYVRQHLGETEFNGDFTALGFSRKTLQDYLTYDVNLIKSGAIPPASVTGGITDTPQSVLVQGKAAFDFAWSNQLIAYEKLANRPLSLMLFPSLPGGNEGMYLDPSMYWSIPSESKHPKEAAMLVDFLTNDLDGGKVLGPERGVPVSSKVKDSLKSSLSATDLKIYDYIDLVGKNSTPIDPVPPKQYNQILTQLNTAIEEARFGKKDPAAATDEFFTKATDTLKNSK